MDTMHQMSGGLPLNHVRLPAVPLPWAERMMDRALELARAYHPAPNPRVGCVIASRTGNILGEGAHQAYGREHAEVLALRMAGPEARGADVFVTLEPCSHYGATPPCAEALAAAGVGSVTAAAVDPDRRVRGRGLAALEAAGIPAWVGLRRAAALQMDPAYHRDRAAE